MEEPHDKTFTVQSDEAGLRLDRFCASKCKSISRSQMQALNDAGGITVDGVKRPDSYLLRESQTVLVRPSAARRDGLAPGEEPVGQTIPINVSYEDDQIVVVNKSAGLVVHPAHGNWDGTLVNALIGRGIKLATLGGNHRPGVVHRLDKDTSGLIVVAKTDAAYAALSAQIKRKEVRKEYHCIVQGNLPQPQMTVDEPISRHPVHRQKMTVAVGSGKEAVTELFVVDSYSHFDYIRVATYTGRTHQIRVHLSYLAHPLLGDAVYGGRKKKAGGLNTRQKVLFEKLLKIMSRHALHASRLSFAHPTTGRWMSLKAALPDDMRLAMETLYREDRSKEV